MSSALENLAGPGKPLDDRIVDDLVAACELVAAKVVALKPPKI